MFGRIDVWKGVKLQKCLPLASFGIRVLADDFCSSLLRLLAPVSSL